MITAHCVRAELEAREAAQLSPFAARSSESKGRAVPEEEDAYRTVYQRDRDRILHTKAFRRLKRKTQVFLAPTGDHFRTRLTHTLEVAQISRTVARALFLNEDLTEAIALGHDLGHTPFGHAGEAVLNEVYAPGFFHFEQSLRVVDLLERRHAGAGLNLTHEVRDGILYHSKGKAVLQGRATDGPNTLEGGVVSVCDAIAYINHDIDDAIRAGVIHTEDLPQDALGVLGDHTSSRIDAMVVGLIVGSQEGKLGIVPEILEAMNTLRDFMYTQVYPCETIDREIRKAKKILRELYFYLLEEPNEEILHGHEGDSLERRTVDFAAGMTDEFALQLYQRLFFPQAMVKVPEAVFEPGEHPIGIVSGSGIHLRPLLDEVLAEVPFAEVAGLARATVAGHDGAFVFGRCGGAPVLLQAGRIHLYEGHTPEAVAATVDALHRFGVRTLILTNAAGGLDENLMPGDWVAADSVVAWRFRGHRFPERMTPDFLVPGCRATGRYIWMHGPCYETRAEIRALQAMGGSTVGMSVALELERCQALSIRAGVVSCVTNNCTTQESLHHAQVVEAAERASAQLCAILRGFIGTAAVLRA